jgi:hypothetical protein
MNEKIKMAYVMGGEEPAREIAEKFFRVSFKSATPSPPGHIRPQRAL